MSLKKTISSLLDDTLAKASTKNEEVFEEKVNGEVKEDSSQVRRESGDTDVLQSRPEDRILKLMNIDKIGIPNGIVRSEDIKLTQFTVTAPTGFDETEVSDFLLILTDAVRQYEEALKKRDKDIVRLAQEVGRIEEKMINTQQAMSLEDLSNEDEEEIIALTYENDRLRKEIDDLKVLVKHKDNEIQDLKQVANAPVELPKPGRISDKLKQDKAKVDESKGKTEELDDDAQVEAAFDSLLDDLMND